MTVKDFGHRAEAAQRTDDGGTDRAGRRGPDRTGRDEAIVAAIEARAAATVGEAAYACVTCRPRQVAGS